MYFIRVSSYTRLVQMPGGRHSAMYVIREIVGLLCMHVFHCFIDFTGSLCKNLEIEKTLWSILWTSVGFADSLSFWG